ncbi:AAA family ATPase [Methanocaldococcus sp.]|uniref:McrB family protein n=1 Tax=Methanocaldococcus sp. TaxID=2152917 RepID=UPI00262E5820|nr:AAA family ATPase [Methanocaldococcus sp.]MCQ6253579.1 AAA family ATPase [Methanocaldococcus sp.]
MLSGEETYKVKICGEKEYSTVFDEEGYVEVPNDRISVGMAGFSYIGENNNIKPETIKEILIKAKNKHEELLKNENIDENRKKELKEIIEKIDKVLKLYFGGDTIIDKILDKKGQIILYGVPGTGKTYLARKYVEEKTNDNKNKYGFITFHQSYSYEDFIEGFRPKTKDNGNGNNIIYEVEDGIFKRMCILAIWEVLKKKEYNENIIVSNIDFSTLIEKFKEKYPVGSTLKTKTGKEFEICRYTDATIYVKPLNGNNEQDLSILINKLKEFYNNNPNIKKPSDIKFAHPSYYYAILEELRQIENELKNTKNENLTYDQIKQKVIEAIKNKSLTKEDFENAPKYYLIIDEINRGNISNILGELITLLEKDKRLGEENEIITTLPYSKEPFAVPPNLYIIGTMNTADRSIALLDIALRRRFGFIEIEPDYDVLNDKNIDEINLAELLKALNDKIVKLKDRDHRIGHSYFLNVNNKDNLWFVWYHEIIPLLEEYFYGDFDSLKKVLGEKFVDVDNCEIKKLEGDEFINALKEIIQNNQ